MKRIVTIGAGFAGLAAAKALRHANADIVVIDRSNHNLFQPLLYQVAATVLSPAQIASPIRGLFKNQRNKTVFVGEVSGINKDAKFVCAGNEDHKDVPLDYDVLRSELDQTRGRSLSRGATVWIEGAVQTPIDCGPCQRTPRRSKEGRKSSTSFSDGSDFLRTIAPSQHVVRSNASLVESCPTEVPFSM
jgi:flavin-dependent dehydrogenase